ncbi:MAG TPA: hypothetical protein VHE37_16950, partial [Nevskiaceae bacterium]|nr:hypothetical protein [Nevskiaceae bacterium]
MLKISAARNAWLFVIAFSVAAASTIGGGAWLQARSPMQKLAAAPCTDPASVQKDGDGDGDADAGTRCAPRRHPESAREFARMGDAWSMRTGQPPDGAIRAALAQKAAMVQTKSAISNAGGTWQAYGQGPLIFNDPAYGQVNGEGMVNVSGRVDAFAYDPATLRVFALPGNGGVWTSTDFGQNWSSIGDRLPTQNNGAVAWTSSNGGTLIVLSGNSDFLGSPSYGGLGAFWTNDLGQTWNQSVGIPDGIYAFELAVDHAHPDIVYAATSRGLFRSTDAGRHFVNVALPTSTDCAGRTDLGKCQFANVVTSVVVQEPGGTSNVAGGAVLAAVGFQEGNTNTFSDGTLVSPGNGLYASPDGAPGSFTKLAVGAASAVSPVGFAPDNRIGRVAMAVAHGDDQDHNYVYALVQDALLMTGGLPYIDVNPTSLGAPVAVPIPTVLNGLYISSDFGQSWTRAFDFVASQNPASGSALAGLQQATGYGPGVQAWYNLWVESDPTVTASNAPSRLFFGLEEVWSSLTASVPQNGTAQLADVVNYHVIGAYYAGTTCGALNLGAIFPNLPPACPGRNPPTATTTTHPDQHGHLVMPDGQGGVYLFAGSDGGVFVQHHAAGENFDNAGWGDGAQNGFNTLLPYDIAVAKDNTVWFGLQDNGSGKIDPVTQKVYETYGGDGFWMAVDPDNSNTAYEEYTNGDISVTTDGGQTWTDMNPNLANPNFANQFYMDPTDAKHILTGGSDIVDTVDGPDTCATNTCTWATLFTL